MVVFLLIPFKTIKKGEPGVPSQKDTPIWILKAMAQQSNTENGSEKQ